MFQPVKVLALDLDRPLETVENLERYGAVFALVRVHGLPVGTVKVPVRGGRCEAEALGKAILAQHWQSVLHRLLQCALRSPVPSGGFRIKDVLAAESQEPPMPAPLVTVAMCTRDRTTSLSPSLDALTRLNYPSLDLLVVDNAPRSDGTERLLGERFPQVRYAREDRPGLNWARNRAIQEAHGEIIAFTDDDAVADPNWISAIVRVFLENPEVMAVTGLVLPYELETESQVTFEEYGGFAKGFERRWYCLERGNGKPDNFHIGAGRFGTGANMAFRRKVFDVIGGFDPALDVGTVTNGGGDLEIFFRVLQEGLPLVYEPAALVWHRHRREHAELKRQIHTWGIGMSSYLVRSALVYRETRPTIVRFSLWFLWWYYIRRLARWPLLDKGLHVDLLLTDFKGIFVGLFRYPQARVRAAQIIKTSGSLPYAMLAARCAPTHACLPSPKITGVRHVDLSQSLRDLTDVTDFSSVCVSVSWQDRRLGDVMVSNQQLVISAERLREAITSEFALRLLDPQDQRSRSSLEAEALAVLTEHYIRSRTRAIAAPNRMRPTATPLVSVMIPTHNSGSYIKDAIESVLAQTYAEYEIIVVDDGSTDNTSTILAPYRERIRYLHQDQRGCPAARNTGIREARGELLALLDADDIWFPTKLELQVRALEAHPEAELAFTDFLDFDDTGVTRKSRLNTWRQASAWFERHRIGTTDVAFGAMYRELLQTNWIHASSVVMRKTVLANVRGFDETFTVGEDYDLWLRIAKTHPFVCVNRVLSGYRYQVDSLCGPLESRPLVHSRGFAQVLEKHLQENAVPPAFRDVAAKKVSQCCWEVGWSLFRRNRLSEARALFWQGFRYHPFHRLLGLYLCASFLPLPIIKAFRRMRGWRKSLLGRPQTAEK